MRKGIKFGIIGAIIIIVSVSAFYLTSPLFISTEIDEPLPEGAEVPAAPPPSNQFQEFIAMSENERIEAGNQMYEQEKNQIMLEFARMNTSIDESMTQINKSLSEQQPSQTRTDTNDTILMRILKGPGCLSELEIYLWHYHYHYHCHRICNP
jgi:hypothetical protein